MNTSKNAPKSRTIPKEKNSSVVKNETKKTTTNSDVGKIKSNQKKVSKNKISEETDLTKKNNNKALSISKTSNAVVAKKTAISNKSTPNLLSTKRRINATDSPSGSRVKKTQYFPSKNLFSNALKSMVHQTQVDELIKKPISNDKTISNDKKSTSSPRPQNIKKKSSKPSSVSEKLISPDSSSATDRPRTATLRKGIIVNANIVGPEVPLEAKLESKIKEPHPEETYEDDFDSYESDFEAASSEISDNNKVEINSLSTTSSTEDIIIENNFSTIHKTPSSAGTDSERKLDSGTFELTDFKHRQILKYIEDTVKKEEAILEFEHGFKAAEKCAHSSLTDEGFHDEQKSLQFINFASAQKKCEQKRINEARKQRGEKLLSMIKLDAMNFTIFDSPSVSYEKFISKFSHGKAMQVSIQTGDDNVDEEIQTDFIENMEKWTQMPIKFSSFQDVDDAGFLSRYRSEFLGCGRVETATENYSSATKFDEIRLEHFLNQASDVVLQLLAEENYNFTGNLNKNPIKLPFSDGYLQFNTSGNILSGSTVIDIKIHPKNFGKVLTIHSFLDAYNNNSVICIWNIVDLETPLNCLRTFGNLVCAEFHLESDQYIFGGQSDGAIIAWDLNRKCKNYDVISQAPSFTSSSSIAHCSKIVSIQNISQEQQNESNEIISLDEAGLLIFWTANFDSTTDNYTGKEITLIKTHEINLQEIYHHLSDFICTDCVIHGNHIYISTNYGNILHYTLKGTPCAVKEFYNDSKIDPTCLELCAFSASHFLAGYFNGDISIFSNNCKEPLLILQNTENKEKNSSIQIISWSKTRPFLFYTKDAANSVHSWDLQKSDMFPEYSIKFPEEIVCLKLSAVANLAEIEEMAYMLISTKTGKLYLYLLNEQYGKINHQIFEKEVKIFLNYLNRL